MIIDMKEIDRARRTKTHIVHPDSMYGEGRALCGVKECRIYNYCRSGVGMPTCQRCQKIALRSKLTKKS